jgi:GR25 family glycosyltransferase involved in LPS biosynthesis
VPLANRVDQPLELLDLEQVRKLIQKVDPSSKLFQRSSELLGGNGDAAPPTPAPTPRRERKFLTIGMSTHDDYDGVYFSVQAIRLYHPEILADIELLVIDNNPAGPCAKALKALDSWIPNYRYLPYQRTQGTAVRDLVFREARGEFVLCMDSHVFFAPGSLARLIAYCRENPATKDLLQGPLLSDAFEPIATQFDPVWSHGMYGQWGMDERGKDPEAPPFEIGMQGLGIFGCRREAWPGFNPRLAGFGGEEGYIHEKIRRAGGRNLCLPFLRWMHRFERPLGLRYPSNWEDRIRNYMLIHDELGTDPRLTIEHFEGLLGKEPAQRMVQAARAEFSSPFHFFDAIYCINLDRQTDRWQAMQRRFQKLRIARRMRRFAAIETPSSHHIGCALSHRGIIAEAKLQGLKSVLVFEDDARFTPDAAEVLEQSLRELEGREWQLLYLGGYRTDQLLRAVPGCRHLVIPAQITCTHAIAYHHSVYDAILEAVPDTAEEVAVWAQRHLAIDQFYTFNLQAKLFLVNPVIATQDSIRACETREFEEDPDPVPTSAQ